MQYITIFALKFFTSNKLTNHVKLYTSTNYNKQYFNLFKHFIDLNILIN